MTPRDTLQLDRQSATLLTVTTDQKEHKKRPTLRRFFVFCQRTVSTFAKPHEPTNNPSIAKELTLAPAQRIKFETLLQTGLYK